MAQRKHALVHLLRGYNCAATSFIAELNAEHLGLEAPNRTLTRHKPQNLAFACKEI